MVYSIVVVVELMAQAFYQEILLLDGVAMLDLDGGVVSTG
jgi:hypothetical protein